MAEEAISLETKLRMVLLGSQPGASITELCGELGISRQTFYKWRHRYQTEGIGGLRERSRRPKHCPHQTPETLEDQIIRLRKELAEDGLDAGARTIRFHLGDGAGIPSEATIHRLLVRRGLVIPQPEKRPRAAWRRFEWARPNDLWQIDATSWRLAGGEEVEIIDCLDDHSRLVPAIGAVAQVTMEAAWETLAEGMIVYGVPARLLSDGGLAFSGRRQGLRVDFEDWVEAHRIHQIVSSPYHPQTLGKVERFHQTLKRWLGARPRAGCLEELRAQLEVFRDYYNHERPHQGIGRRTPAERFCAQERAKPGSALGERPPETKLGYRKVSSVGIVGWGPYNLGVGMAWKGQTVCVIQTGETIEVFSGQELLRRLVPDPSRCYQPSGGPIGRPPRTR